MAKYSLIKTKRLRRYAEVNNNLLMRLEEAESLSRIPEDMVKISVQDFNRLLEEKERLDWLQAQADSNSCSVWDYYTRGLEVSIWASDPIDTAPMTLREAIDKSRNTK